MIRGLVSDAAGPECRGADNDDLRNGVTQGINRVGQVAIFVEIVVTAGRKNRQGYEHD